MTSSKPFDIVAAARKDQLKLRDRYLGISKGIHSDEVIHEAAKRLAPNFKMVYFWGDAVDTAGWMEKTVDARKLSAGRYQQLHRVAERWGGEAWNGVLVTNTTLVYARDASKPDGVALLYFQETKVDAETTMKMSC
ncbi:hypothetical protein SpCBS45565_g03693 [Spizellomyces sp. 'palustris']|nr:hypothetical protein SpCBS45565_g03693 [Spizellomyces sp. 'palustris']